MTIFLTHHKTKLALHALRRAEGPRLLLLHALGERSPESVPGEIAGWPGSVYALDFTGHGQSTVPAGGGYTAEVLMGDADTALAMTGPATVLGWGLGGYVALMLAAVAPTRSVALSLLLLRAALSQMDVPTRSSYVMAVVTQAERAAAASFTSVPRSLAAAASPAIAGALFAASYRAWPLLICGGLKIVYDVLLLVQFREVRPPEERGRD